MDETIPGEYADLPATAPRPSGGSDFAIYTASMELGTMHGAPVVSMIGSSTIRDIEGDTMQESALRDMQRVDPGLMIWMNHSYTLPDDLFGSLVKSPTMSWDGAIADLHLLSDVELSNPNAARTYKYIERGRKLGVSVGARVDKAAIDEDYYEKTGRIALLIESVTPVEWSVVGIPCNQRSWVENAIKGYGLRSLANPGTAEPRLARLVKSLWPKEYDRLARSIQHESLRKMLWSAEAMPMRPQRITWHPPTHEFQLAKGAATQPITREALDELFKQTDHVRDFPHMTPVEGVAGVGGVGADAPLQVAVPLATEHVDADGIVRDPLGDALQKADADKAKRAQAARASKYGIGVKDGGNVSKPSKWSDVPDSQWGDPVNYRYPMKDASHARNALSRWGDADNRSGYSKDEQSVIGGRIKRRAKALGVKPSAS